MGSLLALINKKPAALAMISRYDTAEKADAASCRAENILDRTPLPFHRTEPG